MVKSFAYSLRRKLPNLVRKRIFASNELFEGALDCEGFFFAYGTVKRISSEKKRNNLERVAYN